MPCSTPRERARLRRGPSLSIEGRFRQADLTVSAAVQAIALPIYALDRARLAFLRALGPLAKPLVRSRELRVAVSASIAIVGAFVLAGVAPLLLLALGPVLLGVPHAVMDVRYLVMRPRLHRRPAVWALVFLPTVLVVALVDVRLGILAVLGAAMAARTAWPKRLAAIALALSLLWLADGRERSAALVVAHAHNYVAIALWLAWRKRRTKLHAIPLALVAAGTLAILLGALDPLVERVGGFEGWVFGTDLWYHLGALAPDVEGPLGPRLVLLFAFAQSVHYAIWIRVVPEEDRARETPRTFAASLAAFRADSGALVVALSVLVTLAVALWAAYDVFAAREGYLRGVLFHGWLELGVAMLLLLEGRSLREAAEAESAARARPA